MPKLALKLDLVEPIHYQRPEIWQHSKAWRHKALSRPCDIFLMNRPSDVLARPKLSHLPGFLKERSKLAWAK
jgi:hypothetical protein